MVWLHFRSLRLGDPTENSHDKTPCASSCHCRPDVKLVGRRHKTCLRIVPCAKVLIGQLLAQRAVQRPRNIADLISCATGSQGLSLFNVACISLKWSNTRNQAKQHRSDTSVLSYLEQQIPRRTVTRQGSVQHEPATSHSRRLPGCHMLCGVHKILSTPIKTASRSYHQRSPGAAESSTALTHVSWLAGGSTRNTLETPPGWSVWHSRSTIPHEQRP